MRRTRTPTPEQLNPRRGRTAPRSPVTFRLTAPYEDAFLLLARRARLGRSAFARRIVEHYIREHAPQRVKKGI